MRKTLIDYFNKQSSYLVFLLLWVIAFYNNLDGAYFYDDYDQLVNNPKLHDLFNIKDVIFCELRQIRVLQNITFAIDYFISGEKTWAYHLTNNIIHLCNSLILFSFLKRIKSIPGQVSFVSAIIYLIHPIQVSSVTYIMGRTTLLQVFFIFATLNEIAKGDKRSIIKILFILIGSYLVKENCILIPVIIMIFDYFLNPTLFSKSTFKNEYIYYLLSTLLYLPIFHLLKDPSNMYTETVGFKLYWPIGEYFLAQGFYNFFYLFLFLNPSFHSIYHEYLDFTWQIATMGAASWILLFSAAVFLIRKGKSYPTFSFFFFYFLILHGSTNSFLQMVNPFAEYRLPLSIMSLILSLSYLLWIISQKLKNNLVTVFVVIYFLTFTHLINNLYKNDHLPWIYAKQLYPKSLIIDHELARMELYANHFDNARALLNKAINENPRIKVQVNHLKILIGHSYFFEKKYQSAISSYEQYINKVGPLPDIAIPNYILAHFYLGYTHKFNFLMERLAKIPNKSKVVEDIKRRINEYNEIQHEIISYTLRSQLCFMNGVDVISIIAKSLH